MRIFTYNKSKNIPAEIGDIDSLFYDLDKNPTINVIKTLYENHNHTQQQVAGEETNSIIIEEELKELDNQVTSQTLNTNSKKSQLPELVQEELNFDDMEIEDLPSMDTLTLRQ